MSLTSFYNTNSSSTYIYQDDNVLLNQEISVPSPDTESNSKKHILINYITSQGEDTQLSQENRYIAPWLIFQQTEAMIFEQLYFPIEWHKEKVNRPNLASKNMAMEVCKSLYDNYSLVPFRISPTKEEGLYIRFDCSSASIRRSMIIEVYNTLEIAAIITNNDKKEVNFSYDIERLQFRNAVQHFKKIS